MTSALVAVRDWYNGLNDEMQSEIAHFVFTAMPSLSDKEHLPSDEIISAMRSWLEPGKSDRSLEDLGKAICFGALLDALLGERFTDEGWERAKKSNEFLLKRAEEEGKLNPDLPRRALETMPERAALWKVAGQSWKQVEAEWLGRSGAAKHFGF